jgi:hypothetical protein
MGHLSQVAFAIANRATVQHRGRNRTGAAQTAQSLRQFMIPTAAAGKFGNRCNLAEVSEFHDAIAEKTSMHSIIYIVGLIVVVMAILSFFGLR